ncbi:MAG: hypothetical protein ACUVWO_09115 [Thermodesulfobacteriota bacterium]
MVEAETFWEPFVKTPGNLEFYRAFLNEYQKEPSDHAAAGFAAGQILQRAVKEVGNIEDMKALRDKLYSIKTIAIFGEYEVNPLGHPHSGWQTGQATNLIQWQKAKGKRLLPNWAPISPTGTRGRNSLHLSELYRPDLRLQYPTYPHTHCPDALWGSTVFGPVIGATLFTFIHETLWAELTLLENLVVVGKGEGKAARIGKMTGEK